MYFIFTLIEDYILEKFGIGSIFNNILYISKFNKSYLEIGRLVDDMCFQNKVATIVILESIQIKTFVH